jgi:hypothetical protein
MGCAQSDISEEQYALLLTKCSCDTCKCLSRKKKLHCCTCSKDYSFSDYKTHICACGICGKIVNKNINQTHCGSCHFTFDNKEKKLQHCCKCTPQSTFDNTVKKHCYRCHMFFDKTKEHKCPIPTTMITARECDQYMKHFHETRFFCDTCLKYHKKQNLQKPHQQIKINMNTEKTNTEKTNTEKTNTCQICFCQYSQKTAFVPCGHCISCEKCTQAIMVSKQCPMCRRSISHVLNLYES